MTAMSDAYAAAGVDTSQADRGVDALVGVLRRIEIDRPSASVLASGHYASVLARTNFQPDTSFKEAEIPTSGPPPQQPPLF